MQPRIQVAEPELSLNPGGLPFSTPSGSVPTMGFNDRKKKPILHRYSQIRILNFQSKSRHTATTFVLAVTRKSVKMEKHFSWNSHI